MLGDRGIYSRSVIEDGAFRDQEFMKKYESRGRAVRVSEGGRVTIELGID
jgi:hypothetical protein